MNRLASYRRAIVLLVAALGLTLLGPVSAGASQPASSAPALTNASLRMGQPGEVWIEGFDFTPDGNVYIAIYDNWGAELYETRWITADSTVMGTDGTANPLTGYTEGGYVGETFAIDCGSEAMVRAYDQESGAWTDWLDVDPAC